MSSHRAWASVVSISAFVLGCGSTDRDELPPTTQEPQPLCANFALTKTWTIPALDATLAAYPVFTPVSDERAALTFVAHGVEENTLWHVALEPGAPAGLEQALSGSPLLEVHPSGLFSFATAGAEPSGRYTLAVSPIPNESLLFTNLEPGAAAPEQQTTLPDIPWRISFVTPSGLVGYSHVAPEATYQLVRAADWPAERESIVLGCGQYGAISVAAEIDGATYVAAASSAELGNCEASVPAGGANRLQLYRIDDGKPTPLFEVVEPVIPEGGGRIDWVEMVGDDDGLWLVWTTHHGVRAQRVTLEGAAATPVLDVAGDNVGFSASQLGERLAIATALYRGDEPVIDVHVYDRAGNRDLTLELDGHVAAGLALAGSPDGASFVLATTGGEHALTLRGFDCTDP